MRRRRALGLLGGALAGGLAAGATVACSGAVDTAGRGRSRERVVFWGLGREGEVVAELLPEFARRHPEVDVVVQQIPWTAAHEKLLTAYVGRTTPDVAQVGNTWLPEFVALEALEPLDARLASSVSPSAAPSPSAGPSITADRYFEGIWKTNVLEGRTWGVPWYVDTRVLFYRTDMLAAAGVAGPPRTWDALVDALRRVQARQPAGRFAILLPTDEWAQLTILALQKGAPVLRDGGRYGGFREARFREAFEFYVGLFRQGFAPPTSTTFVTNQYQQFEAGEFAFYVTGPWNLGEFRRRLSPAMNGRWTTAPLPSPDPADPSRGLSIAGGSSLVVFRRSEAKDGALKLIAYLSDPATQLRFYQLTGDLPARKEAWSDPLLANDREARAFEDQLNRVHPLPQVPEWEQIATRMFQVAEHAIRGRLTTDEALAKLDGDVDRMLEKRRYLLDVKAENGRKG